MGFRFQSLGFRVPGLFSVVSCSGLRVRIYWLCRAWGFEISRRRTQKPKP